MCVPISTHDDTLAPKGSTGSRHIQKTPLMQIRKKLINANTPQKGSAKRAEIQVWEKLCEFALDQAVLMAQAKRLANNFEQKQGSL